jgi:hypothetical protein
VINTADSALIAIRPARDAPDRRGGGEPDTVAPLNGSVIALLGATAAECLPIDT